MLTWAGASARCWDFCTRHPPRSPAVSQLLRTPLSSTNSAWARFTAASRIAGPRSLAQSAQLIDQMLSCREVLCHGDYTPKNILVHEQGFTLVDYETAYFGDPTMDLGLCLAHLVLKSIRRPEQRAGYRQLMRSFWNGYFSAVTFRPAAELEHRALAHLGANLLARIDGTSPVDYLPEEEKRAAVRELGRKLLLEQIAGWGDLETLLGASQHQ